MLDIVFSPGSSALVIVAHPDDETIWFAGTMIANPQVDWTILCLSRSSDSDRSPKFARVAKKLGAKGLIDDWDDEGRLSAKQAIAEAKRIIGERIGAKHFDFVVTHGANGEYGHERHRQLSHAVNDLVARRKLSANLLLNFNYKKLSRYRLTPKADSDLIFKLPAKIFKNKLALMTELYGFDPKGIDVGYSTNTEALKIITACKHKK